MRNNIKTIGVIVITILLAGVSIFTALRIYNLRTQPIAPTAPTSNPKAAELETACELLVFNISSPTPTATATVTATATATATATVTATPTATATVTATPTATATVTATPTATPITAMCVAINVYDLDWNLLTVADLALMKAGDSVYFTVYGSTSAGTFDKARFTINGVVGPEVNNVKPGTDEFYYQYTFPSSVTSFTVKGEVHHAILDAWF